MALDEVATLTHQEEAAQRSDVEDGTNWRLDVGREAIITQGAENVELVLDLPHSTRDGG